jgi:hypothetical protein
MHGVEVVLTDKHDGEAVQRSKRKRLVEDTLLAGSITKIRYGDILPATVL